jgi:hypothetical protein
MRQTSAIHVAHGKGHALPHPRSGGLTCSEWQVDDVLSAGESTDEARLHTATDPAQPAIELGAKSSS